MFFINDYTIMTWVDLFKQNFEDFDKFKAFKALVKNETNIKIKCLRNDRGGDFTSNE